MNDSTIAFRAKEQLGKFTMIVTAVAGLVGYLVSDSFRELLEIRTEIAGCE